MEKVKISDVVKIVNNSVSRYEGVRPFLSTGDLNISKIENLEWLTFNEKPSRANLNVAEGDVIVARMQGTVKVKIIEQSEADIIVSTGFLVLRKKDNIDINYLFNYLKASNFQNDKNALCTGATQKAINNENFAKIQIPLPPLLIQKAIAAKLDKAQEIIAYNKQLLEKYDQLTQALFIDMFGDPVRNERGWTKKQFQHFGKISTGNTPSRADLSNYSSKFIEWIKTDNIVESDLFVSKSSEHLSESGSKKGRIAEKDSLLVACIAGSINSIGRAALTNRKVAFNQQINAVTPNSDVNPSFLYYLVKNSRKHIQSFASNGMKRMLSKSEFQKIPMIYPPIRNQNQFAERVEKIEIQKKMAQESLAKSEQLFQSLLKESFR